jgi:hypothetical protein
MTSDTTRVRTRISLKNKIEDNGEKGANKTQ